MSIFEERKDLILGTIAIWCGRTLEPHATLKGRIMEFSSVRELLFSQVREKTNILAEPRITFLRRKLLLEKSTKTRITLRNVILGGFVREL